MKTNALVIKTIMEHPDFLENWLNDILCIVSEAYYSGATLPIDTINRYRGIIESATNVNMLDEYESDLVYFQLFKIECRNL